MTTTDHAAQLRHAITETRIVFESEPAAGEALDYLEAVLANIPAQPGTAGAALVVGGECHRGFAGNIPLAADKATAAMAAESAQLVADAERSVAARGEPAALAELSREVFSLSSKLQQPADLAVQLLVLAELRSQRRDMHVAGRTFSV
ncbi:hypothetical protein ACEN9F_30510 [Duganella sp. CT11-25]|uniref:hypothetical protein n=1 Tax=unclassified Duganella TaxID=2636909 RepID=UPI0039AECE9E